MTPNPETLTAASLEMGDCVQIGSSWMVVQVVRRLSDRVVVEADAHDLALTLELPFDTELQVLPHPTVG